MSIDVNGIIETPVGPVRYTLTDPDHVHLNAGSGGDEVGPLPYRGSSYYASVHVNRDLAGEWVIGMDPYIKKHMPADWRKDQAPPTHKAAIAAALRDAWVSFIEAHHELVIAAHRADADDKEARLAKKLRDAQADVAAAEQALAEHHVAMMFRANRVRGLGGPAVIATEAASDGERIASETGLDVVIA